MKSLKKAVAVLLSALTLTASVVTAGAAEIKKPAEPVGDADTKIYFDANSTGWSGYKRVMLYLYNVDTGDVLLQWASKKTAMTNEGDGLYSYDMESLDLDINTNYACIFNADSGAQTCDLFVNTPCFGHTAACTGNSLENTVDSNKTSQEVVWDSGVDSSQYGVPLAITSLGNVIGSALAKGKTKYDMLVDFIKGSEDGLMGLENALKFSSKTGRDTEQKQIDYVAEALGLTKADVENAIADSGKTVAWNAADSTIPDEPTDDYLAGDVDGNGTVNVADRIKLTRYLAGWEANKEIVEKNSDLNGDSKVNVADRIILTRHLAGWEDYATLPIGA